MFIIRLALLMLLATPLYLAAQKPAEAKPAEAKPAPGPNTLTGAQQQALQQALQAAESAGQTEAAPLAAKIAVIAKSFDRNALSEKPDAELDGKLSNQLVAAVGEVVTAALHAKLNGVHEIVKVLTPEQKKVLLAELDKPDTNPDLTELVGNVLGEKKK
jgi:spore germination cell wall hydrolase CwlJ-like protein